MGAVVASLLEQPVLWAGAGRSTSTARRAGDAGLVDVGTVEDLGHRADVVVAVCPPESAEVVADQVASTGFTGLYVDANAISPATARRVADRFERFVDGGIVGPPPTGPGTTRLYLSGNEAPAVAALFDGTHLEARVVDGPAGAASAVKMGFAAWTKGTSALLVAIRAMARAEDVEADLLAEWATSRPDLVERSGAVVGQVGPKAWRFEAEMREIAATFESDGLPPGFHLAAAEVYRRLAPLKDTTGPTLEEALDLLARPSTAGGQRSGQTGK